MPRCSNNLCQPRIVSSFNSNASATCWQLQPLSNSTSAFARRVIRDVAEPSRTNATSWSRSSALRKPPRIMLPSGIHHATKRKHFLRFLNESGYMWILGIVLVSLV